mmetsp:Transcript_15675/g.43411  ORF Transcript_15675/g.43411 Transcript_15675/m.43411 type:complete len:128 (-) Transcript_15675:1102-1485(-)
MCASRNLQGRLKKCCSRNPQRDQPYNLGHNLNTTGGTSLVERANDSKEGLSGNPSNNAPLSGQMVTFELHSLHQVLLGSHRLVLAGGRDQDREQQLDSVQKIPLLFDFSVTVQDLSSSVLSAYHTAN